MIRNDRREFVVETFALRILNPRNPRLDGGRAICATLKKSSSIRVRTYEEMNKYEGKFRNRATKRFFARRPTFAFIPIPFGD